MIRVIFVLHTVQSQLCSCQRNLHMPTSTKVEINWKAVGRRIREIRGFEVNQAGFEVKLGDAGDSSQDTSRGAGVGAAVLPPLSAQVGKKQSSGC